MLNVTLKDLMKKENVMGFDEKSMISKANLQNRIRVVFGYIPKIHGLLIFIHNPESGVTAFRVLTVI